MSGSLKQADPLPSDSQPWVHRLLMFVTVTSAHILFSGEDTCSPTAETIYMVLIFIVPKPNRLVNKVKAERKWECWQRGGLAPCLHISLHKTAHPQVTDQTQVLPWAALCFLLHSNLFSGVYRFLPCTFVAQEWCVLNSPFPSKRKLNYRLFG